MLNSTEDAVVDAAVAVVVEAVVVVVEAAVAAQLRLQLRHQSNKHSQQLQPTQTASAFTVEYKATLAKIATGVVVMSTRSAISVKTPDTDKITVRKQGDGATRANHPQLLHQQLTPRQLQQLQLQLQMLRHLPSQHHYT